MYLYIKALHVIFIVTWFAGMFYIVRLFIYLREAQDKDEPEKSILTKQMTLMSRRLWYGITWPSAILTLIFGGWILYLYWSLIHTIESWLWLKLLFVVGLYAYQFTLHYIFKLQLKGNFKHSSQHLRVWNEVATIFLVVIIMLVIVRQNLSVVWGLGGLFAFIVLLMSAINIYKRLRK